MRDFNEILSSHEKYGRKQRAERQMEDFRHVVFCNSLHDLGWKGNPFTWSNKQACSNFTKERLD